MRPAMAPPANARVHSSFGNTDICSRPNRCHLRRDHYQRRLCRADPDRWSDFEQCNRATLGTPTQATIRIDDDEESPATTNPLDTAEYFVTQHYYDFLSRVPDSGGLQFWTSQIAGPPPCPNGDQVWLVGAGAASPSRTLSSLSWSINRRVPCLPFVPVAFGNQQPFRIQFPIRTFRTMIRSGPATRSSQTIVPRLWAAPIWPRHS